MASRIFLVLGLASLLGAGAASLGGCGKVESNIRPPSPGSGNAVGSTAGSGGAGGGGTGGACGTGGAGGVMTTCGTGGIIEKPPSCSDGVQSPDESDIDCGGVCAPCTGMKKCIVDADCDSGFCPPDSQLCLAPSCLDTKKNQNETDVDCGGDCQFKCAAGQNCLVNDDCDDKRCLSNECQEATCMDGVKNGVESDIDCGSTCPKLCPIGSKCLNADDCQSALCGTTCLCPPGMVIVPILGGGDYCIDQTEVIYDDYAIFYNANPPVANLPPYCSYKTDFTPDGLWPKPNGGSTLPVTYVDWCDAFAYCAYKGKHLCGKIGGGDNALEDFADTQTSSWFNACTAQGNNIYPYGDNFQSTFCFGKAFSNSGANLGCTGKPDGQMIDAPCKDADANSLDICFGGFCSHILPSSPATSNCQGGAPGLWHMSGNVAEWEDSCTGYTNGSDLCRLRGGDFLSTGPELRCDKDEIKPREYVGPDVGIRCCL